MSTAVTTDTCTGLLHMRRRPHALLFVKWVDQAVVYPFDYQLSGLSLEPRCPDNLVLLYSHTTGSIQIPRSQYSYYDIGFAFQ